MDVVAQVITVVAVLLVMDGVGVAMSWVVVTELVAVHPLPSVTVAV
jgi:hypothetical protein